MYDPESRRLEFQKLQEWGVRGVKVDFFQSDKQNIIRHYLDILADAADYEIMVNFHGCTMPRGWERTWPHLMTMEAVRGAESYSFGPEYPEYAYWHNTILPFTRIVVGSMDYTPVAFSDQRYPHLTTYGHELALSVVFESGILHMADAVESYVSLPPAPKAFLQNVPVAWDETRYLVGEPGTFVVLARRHGQDWYVAGINGQDEEVSIDIEFSFLETGPYDMTLIEDGPTDRSFNVVTDSINTGDAVPVTMRPRGGFVIRLEK